MSGTWPEKGVRLGTYAARCIENEVLMYFRGRKKQSQDVSLSDCIETGTDGASLSLMDVVSQDGDLLEEISSRDLIRRVMEDIDTCLTERERQVILLRYGLRGNAPHRQRDVADKLGISRSYVSRIEKRALEKLYSKLEN